MKREVLIGVLLASGLFFGGISCRCAEEGFSQILKDAKDKAHRGRNEEAIAAFSRALNLNTNCAECFSGRALAKLQLRDVAGAEADAEAAIRLDSKLFASYLVRGLIRADRDDLDGALADLDQAIKIYPEAFSLYEIRGNVRHNAGDSTGALADYTLAIKNTGSSRAYIERARVKAENGDFDGALGDCGQAIRKDSASGGAYSSRAHIRAAMNDLNGSLTDFDQAVKLETNRASLYACRGLTKQRAGDKKGALEDFRLAVESNSTNHDYGSINLWVAQCLAGERPKANAELSAYLKVRQVAGASKWTLALMQFLIGKLSEADLAKEYHSPSPKKDLNQRCEFYYYTGMKKLVEGDKTGARQAFRECVTTRRATLCEFGNARVQLDGLAK